MNEVDKWTRYKTTGCNCCGRDIVSVMGEKAPRFCPACIEAHGSKLAPRVYLQTSCPVAQEEQRAFEERLASLPPMKRAIKPASAAQSWKTDRWAP